MSTLINACHCEPVTDVTGVAIRSPLPSLGVVLRAANQNLTIASGNCSIMYRWHGAAVTDEGYLPLPMGEVPRRGREGVLLPSLLLRDSSPRVGAKGERRKRIATPVCGLVRNDMIFRQLAMLPDWREHLFYILYGLGQNVQE